MSQLHDIGQFPKKGKMTEEVAREMMIRNLRTAEENEADDLGRNEQRAASILALDAERWPPCARCSHAETSHRGSIKGLIGHVCLNDKCFCRGYVAIPPEDE